MDPCVAFFELTTLAVWGFYSSTYNLTFSISTGVFLVGNFLLIFFFRLFYALSTLREYVTLTNIRTFLIINGILLGFGMSFWISKEIYFLVDSYDQLYIIYKYLLLPWLGILILVNVSTYYIAIQTYKDLRRRRRLQNRIDYLIANPAEIQAFEASMGLMDYSQNLRQKLLNREGLQQGEIDKLQRRTLTEQNLRNSGSGQIDCVICTQRLAVSEVVIDLPCFHYYHEVCIESWLRRSPTCPVCRFSVKMHLAV